LVNYRNKLLESLNENQVKESPKGKQAEPVREFKITGGDQDTVMKERELTPENENESPDASIEEFPVYVEEYCFIT
jgi:hypothetical protein